MASFLTTHRKLFTFVFSLTIGAAATGLWLNSHPGDIPSSSTVILGAPVGYLSFHDLLAATNATLQVTVTSPPTMYIDFGADGRPDYDGQPGLPVELVSATVNEVLRGNPSLKGASIFVSQPSSLRPTRNGTAVDRIVFGSRYVIVASDVVPNPGVGTSPTVWVPAGSGQGIFDINSDGSLSVRKAGVWPEIFGKNGSLRVMNLPSS